MSDNNDLIERVIDALLEALKAKLVTSTLTVGEIVALSHPKAADEPFLTAEQVSQQFQVSKSYVYAHARELGAKKFGRALRFSPAAVRAYLAGKGRQP